MTESVHFSNFGQQQRRRNLIARLEQRIVTHPDEAPKLRRAIEKHEAKNREIDTLQAAKRAAETE